jgi:hypothetical protein
MKEKIAVATVSGKAYFLIVNELKNRNIPFISLMPKDSVPIEIKAVITTEKERPLITHERVLVYKEDAEPEALINEAMQIVQGKNQYERLVIGVDPGKVFGLAVLADGKVVETSNCFSVEEAGERIKGILKGFENTQIVTVSVRIGDGVPDCKERLLRLLDNALSPSVVLESVSEAGTNRNISVAMNRRGLRDIASAIKIAGRSGHIFKRRGTYESNT